MTTHPKHAGFTILELMITLAVFAVLVGVAAPNMQEFVRNSRTRSAAYDLANAINYARSESVKHGVRVNLCRSADPLAATPACGGNANDWSTGWIVFVARDSNDTYEASTDTLLARYAGPPEGVTIRTNSIANNYLEYRADGSTDETGVARFAVCDQRGVSRGRQVNIPLMGRPSLTAGSDDNPLNSCTSPT